jgi:hypothetical protein
VFVANPLLSPAASGAFLKAKIARFLMAITSAEGRVSAFSYQVMNGIGNAGHPEGRSASPKPAICASSLTQGASSCSMRKISIHTFLKTITRVLILPKTIKIPWD